MRWYGFTQEEIKEMMKEQNIEKETQEELMPIMKENYDGYKFSMNAKENMYNSNMTLNFLADYVRLGRMPESLVDVNIASDYSKLGKMLNLCKGENREKIIEKSISGEGIVGEIADKFNPEIGFGDKELVSMLFYLGYLTIAGERIGKPELKIPNKIMKEIYADYFLKILKENTKIEITESNYNEMLEEMAYEGKIDKILEKLEEYLNNLSNRDYQRFDEKYVKVIFYSIAMNLKFVYNVKSEMEVNRKYPDLMLIAKDKSKEYNSIMIEFKYLKRGEENQLEEKQKEARAQIEEYREFEELKAIPKLNCYTAVAVVDKIYVEKI